MVHSVFELGDTIVREVMVPRTDLVMIERYKTIRQALTLALRSGFSRIPVTGENEDDIVGIVYLKDLARRRHINRDAETDPVATAHAAGQPSCPTPRTPATCCARCSSERNHVAVVDRRVRRHGRTGHHRGHPRGDRRRDHRRVRPRTPAGRGPGRRPLPGHRPAATSATWASCSGVELDDEDVETVGGLLAKALGRVPIPGATAIVALPEDASPRPPPARRPPCG